MNYLAPAGTPIKFRHFRKWLGNILGFTGGRHDLTNALKDKFNKKHVFLISSGRTALYLILKRLHALSGDSNRNEVIVPAYTCYSVPGSIAKAGLKIRICDIDPTTLSYDLEELNTIDFSNVLAIVTANLYGIPNDLSAIEDLAKQQGVFLVDDAAQSMGAKVDGRYCGTFGDVGLFSLDKGKNITSIQGGIILTDSDDIANELRDEFRTISTQPMIDLTIECIKLIIYALLLPPSRYWIITKIPFLSLGTTPYTTDYPVHQYSNLLAKFTSTLFVELDQLSEQRKNNAEEIIRELAELKVLRLLEVSGKIEPVYVRLPVFVSDSHLRDKLIQALHTNGIGATGSYPLPISDIPDIQDLIIGNKSPANGKIAAKTIITLPCNPYLTNNHLVSITSVINDVLKTET